MQLTFEEANDLCNRVRSDDEGQFRKTFSLSFKNTLDIFLWLHFSEWNIFESNSSKWKIKFTGKKIL